MAFAAQKLIAGAEPVWIVEIDVDKCTRTYGVAPCTATGGVGDECYNTQATCEDTTNYNGGGANVQTYRFCQPRVNIPVDLGAIPSLRGVSMQPTRMTPGEGLGERTKVTLTFIDSPHHDVTFDPYVATRTYTPMEQGTFWGKFKARHKYYQGRTVRVRLGYVTDPWDWTNFITYTYLLEQIKGPDSQGRVQIIVKDVLKQADDKRAQAPAINTGYLERDISTTDTTANLLPVGVGAAEYSASGTIRIGSECIEFTRAGDVLTLTSRGTDGTTAEEHGIDDAVQECLRYTDERIDDIIYDLLTTYAGTAAAYITFADWQAEVDTWLTGHAASALITEPTGVKELINEICEQFMVSLWWDALTAKIIFDVLSPTIGALTAIDEDDIVADSISVAEEPQRRLSQVWIYYGVINQTEPLDEPKNYRNLQVYTDADAELAVQYGEARVKKYFSRWITAAGDALRLGGRTISRFRDNPRKLKMQLDAKDSTLDIGDTFSIDTRELQDAAGANVPSDFQIISKRDSIPGHQLEYEAQEYSFPGRYGGVAPNAMGDYAVESAANRLIYFFISTNGPPPLMSDGTAAYTII